MNDGYERCEKCQNECDDDENKTSEFMQVYCGKRYIMALKPHVGQRSR